MNEPKRLTAALQLSENVKRKKFVIVQRCISLNLRWKNIDVNHSEAEKNVQQHRCAQLVWAWLCWCESFTSDGAASKWVSLYSILLPAATRSFCRTSQKYGKKAFNTRGAAEKAFTLHWQSFFFFRWKIAFSHWQQHQAWEECKN